MKYKTWKRPLRRPRMRWKGNGDMGRMGIMRSVRGGWIDTYQPMHH